MLRARVGCLMGKRSTHRVLNEPMKGLLRDAPWLLRCFALNDFTFILIAGEHNVLSLECNCVNWFWM